MTTQLQLINIIIIIIIIIIKRPDRLSDSPSLLFSRGLGAIFPGLYGWGVKLPLTALSAEVKNKKSGLNTSTLSYVFMA